MHDVRVTGVAEAHAIEINHGLKSGGCRGATSLLDRRFGIEDAIDPLCCRKSNHSLV